MKILLCNKFYYRRGGDCIYTMNLEQLLKAHGHEVAIFSQQYPLNEPSPWSKYWPSEFKMKPSLNMVDSLLRPFGLGSVKKCFNAILDDFFGPENGAADQYKDGAADQYKDGSSNQYKDCVVHLNNIHTQLSPILAEIAHKRGIRVIWTIHDTKLVCPSYTCMRDGKWCEECFSDKKAVLRHRCMTGGALGSYIGYKEAQKWTVERIENAVDAFICPSRFMANTMQRGGYQAKKLTVHSNFIDVNKVAGVNGSREDYYVYLGQLNKIKGIQTLCKAAASLPYKLIVIGGGFMEEELRNQYADCSQIEFKGQLKWEEIKPLLGKARFMVLPSECSENNPISVIESLSLGTPVLGANIGGIPELINDKNGDTFESGKTDQLKAKICSMWEREFDHEAIAQRSVEQYSAENYYQELISLYK